MTWPEFKQYCRGRGLSARIEAASVGELHVEVWEGCPQGQPPVFDQLVDWVPGWCDVVIEQLLDESLEGRL